MTAVNSEHRDKTVVVGDPHLPLNSLLYNVFSVPGLIYSAEKNILISPILKNCSSSLELWCTENYEFLELPAYQTSFYYITWTKARRIIRERQPEMITILRDPLQRAQSAIQMRARQFRNEGVCVNWDNFSELNITQDAHIVPQSCFVPLSSEKDYLGFDLDEYYFLSDVGGWTSLLEKYQLPSKLSEKNTFFYMLPGTNTMKQLGEYIDEPELQQVWDNKANEYNWLNYLGEMPEDYQEYIKGVYQHDYDLISAVNFVNCTQDQINSHAH